MRRTLATLAVAALLVVAGCSGGGDTTTTPEYDTDAEPLYETPLDAEAMTAAHMDAVREHGTFTIDQNTTWGDSEGERDVQTALVRVNLDTGAVYGLWKYDNTTRQIYQFGNGTVYNRRVSGGEAAYQRGGATTNATEYATGGFPAVVEMFAFSYAGTKTVDDELVYVYRANGPEAVDTSAIPYLGQSENVTVDRAEAALRVHEDGTLARVAYSLEFGNDVPLDAISTTWRFEGLGDTDTSPPGWVPAARNATE